MEAGSGPESGEGIAVRNRRFSRRAFAVLVAPILSRLAAILPAKSETHAASSNREAIVSMRPLRYRSERMAVNTRMRK